MYTVYIQIIDLFLKKVIKSQNIRTPTGIYRTSKDRFWQKNQKIPDFTEKR